MEQQGSLELVRLAGRPADWDQQIQRFPNTSLFHESSWLEYVRSTQPRCQIEYFEIRRGPECIGYFCAVRAKKFVFSFWGSPFPWSGMYMGPVVEPQVDQDELLHLLMEHCRAERIAQLELINDWLDPAVMQAAGFQVGTSVTHVCPLTGGVESVWAGMNGTCRTRIRKAEKSGLVVERTDDPGVIEEFHPQFVRVLARKGLKPAYDLEQARSLFQHLGSADRLFALRVRLQDRVIATGFYPHDDRTLYYWDSAYEPDCLQLCPNNLMHWTAMKMAIEAGITTFNMGGGPQPSRFTQKFGGSLQPYLTYRKSFVPFLEEAYQVYKFLVRQRCAASRLFEERPGRVHGDPET